MEKKAEKTSEGVQEDIQTDIEKDIQKEVWTEVQEDVLETESTFAKAENERNVRQKSRKKNKAGKIAAIALCFGILGFGIYYLAGMYLGDKKVEDEYEALQQYVVAEVPEAEEIPDAAVEEDTEAASDEEETSGDETQEARVQFEELKAQNPNVIAWIEIPGTAVSYPVMHADDNSYYLNHTFQKTLNHAGSIFMETLNTMDFSDLHTLVYGNNEKNGTMFGSLESYEAPSYFVAHPYIYIDTESGTEQYQIFSCYKAESNSDSYTIGFERNEEFEAFLQTIKSRSIYDTGVEVNIEDKILSLSTCVKAGSDQRFIVHARWVY